MKLLRDQRAHVIGENKRLAAKWEAADVSNAEMLLTMDQMALNLNLISVQRDEAPAKVEALREVTEGKIKRIIQYYDNPHTPPHNRTITGRKINKQKKEWEKRNNSTGRKGRHLGCKNTAVSRRATRTVAYLPDKCGDCGG